MGCGCTQNQPQNFVPTAFSPGPAFYPLAAQQSETDTIVHLLIFLGVAFGVYWVMNQGHRIKRSRKRRNIVYKLGRSWDEDAWMHDRY